MNEHAQLDLAVSNILLVNFLNHVYHQPADKDERAINTLKAYYDAVLYDIEKNLTSEERKYIQERIDFYNKKFDLQLSWG